MPHRTFFLVIAVGLGISTVGCSSIGRMHRTGANSDDPPKVPGSLAAKVVLRSTVLATASAPIVSTKVGVRMLGERGYRLLTGSSMPTSMKMHEADPAGLPQPGEDAFEVLLDREGLRARSLGSVEFLIDGEAFFPALHRAIEEARESVDVQTYIFDNDSVAKNVADLLKRKSHQVPVRVYYDFIGSESSFDKTHGLAKDDPRAKAVPNLVSYLTENSKVEVRRTFNPYTVADHTKVQVLDDRVAFVGGMNIGYEYRHPWHDMMARVEGPVVSLLSGVFHDHWRGEEWLPFLRGSTGRRPGPVPPGQNPEGLNHVPLRMLVTDTPHGKREILKATLAAIRCARQRVWIETPYISSDEISSELEKAVKRGVDVRVIIPASPDSKTMKKVNASEVADLVKMGAKVYEYPGMTHLKATVCDGWITFGSANYDTLSMRINRELNLATSDPTTVQKLVRAVFEPDFRRSTRLTREEATARGGLLAEFLGDQL